PLEWSAPSGHHVDLVVAGAVAVEGDRRRQVHEGERGDRGRTALSLDGGGDRGGPGGEAGDDSGRRHGGDALVAARPGDGPPEEPGAGSVLHGDAQLRGLAAQHGRGRGGYGHRGDGHAAHGAPAAADLAREARDCSRKRGRRIAGDGGTVLTARDLEDDRVRRNRHVAAGDRYADGVVRKGARPLDARSDLSVRAFECAARLRENVRPGVTTGDPLRKVHEGLREIPHATDVDEL